MKKILLATTVMAGLYSFPAIAQSNAAVEQAGDEQQAPSGGIEEIVVTAQQRSENLQRAAISVSAVSSDSLVRGNVTDVTRLTTLVPAFRSNPTSGPYANFAIRGISNFTTNSQQDNGTVVNIGGVPLARPSGPNGMFFDLERVEILKGPQGILYGRNATGGVVNIIPKGPGDEFGGTVSVNVGNYDLLQLNAAVDVPVSDTITTRVAFQSVRRDGYYQDGTSDDDATSARATIRFEPSSMVDFTLVGDYSRQRGLGPGASLIFSETATTNTTGQRGFVVGPWTGQINPDPRIQGVFTAAGAPVRRLDSVYQDNTYWGITGTLNVETSLGKITAIGAHRVTDVDFESMVATFYNGETGPQNQDSLELRLASSNDNPFRYLFGAFYLDEEAHIQQINEQGTGLSNSSINIRNKTIGVFGQLTYAFSDSFRLSGGIRYNADDKTSLSPRYTIPNYPFTTTSLRNRPAQGAGNFVGIVDQQRTFESVTWRAGVEFDAAPDSLLYANVGTGFKSGGFTFGPPGGAVYEPEHVTSYVVGSKNRFFDRRLQLNVEAYYLQYRDQQVQFFALLPGIGNFSVTQNVAKSTIYGVEFDAIALLTDTTRLAIGGQFQKTSYDSYNYFTPNDPRNTQTCPVTIAQGGFNVNCSGRDLINAPEVVLQAAIDQTFELGNGGSLVATLSGRYESSRQTNLQYLQEAKADSYTKTDASLTYNSPDRSWNISAYVMNLEDKAVFAIVNPGRTYSITRGGILNTSLQPPRTYGLRATFNF
ncbi:TonB-dependent receptor [Blastomonas fulva]|uniref:TonB-dependent receptor n=1 Tax=Blastomonas fulva TaxID=1550728 RepID=UPI003F72595B